MARNETVRRTGRPPAGAGGQRVRDYPQINVRVPPLVRTRLITLTRLTGWSQLEVLTRAIDGLWRREASRRRLPRKKTRR